MAARPTALALACALLLALAATPTRAQGTGTGAGGVREMIRQRAAADSARAAPGAAGAPPARVAPAAPVPAAAFADTGLGAGPRVPGTTLRMGAGYGRVRRQSGYAPADAPEAAPGEAVLAGPLSFFGVDGQGRLTFGAAGLTRLAWTAQPISPNERDYVEDQLRRLGYRRDCRRLDDLGRECDWTGGLWIHLKSDTAGMTAEIAAVGAGPGREVHVMTAAERESLAEAARLRPILADPTPILDDTLSLDPAAAPGRHAPPAVLQAFPPAYDDALRARGVTGIVRVLALVGTDGRVVYARAHDGPDELRPIARDTLSRYRFGGYVDAGRPVRFWVWVPVRFGV